ncbi:hypothetical protein H9N25_10355 [Pedobacter riviphilus]|uniref:Uncharacterized protein n=1 Tax=Pedobacter riviphilus TaxID=2766984 RepID=A0ABX6TMK8_9SPHI|nr:hypothetical protein [Pedobacter riviphilus]QNR86746.1 hypothetical protein H9N25_10355 [Pedobacter riviphilus]
MKLLSTKIFLFLIGISFCASAQWSKKQEVQFTVQIFNLGKTIGLSDSQATDYTICCIEKFKVKMPDPSKVSPDQAKVIGKEIGAICLENMTLNFKWTEASEDFVKNYFNSQKELSVLSKEARDKFNSCVIQKLKTRYPNGFSKLPEDVASEIGKKCIESVLDEKK